MTNLPERELLEKLVELGNSFRETSINDADFYDKQKAFDSILKESTKFIENNRSPYLLEKRIVEDGCMGRQDVIVTILRR